MSTKDTTKTVPVTVKIDPKGFYLYWINQSKVIHTLQSGADTVWPDCSYVMEAVTFG